MPAKKRTWILIADAASARILTLEGSPQDRAPIVTATFENPAVHGHSRDLVCDKPGRSFESVGSMRHAQEPRVDPHRQAKSAFARTIADYLDRADRDGKFDQIILVAPPVTLGDLRAMLGKRVAKRVAGEIGKDLTKTPGAEVVAQLPVGVRL